MRHLAVAVLERAPQSRVLLMIGKSSPSRLLLYILKYPVTLVLLSAELHPEGNNGQDRVEVIVKTIGPASNW